MKKAAKLSTVLTLIVFITIALVSRANAIPQKDKKYEDLPVAKVGSDKITYSELERAYKKNMNRDNVDLYQIPKDSALDFLNLYINYRLKVKDAIDRGYHKDSSVIEDIEKNKKILAETYYYEKKLMKPWLKKMLKHRNKEYKIAVIVITFPPKPNTDTMQAYKKAKSCLELIKKGEPFQEVASDSSEDPESAKFGGTVRTWITAGNVQRPIEKAILNLEEGEFHPRLIKTRYGYFIVKLLDSEPRELVKAKHILLQFGKKDSAEVYSKAEQILSKLKNGADFKELAKKYSDDQSTASKGGELGQYYSRSTGFEKSKNRLTPGFETALFNLKNGETSDIVSTVYGLHIIKRDSSKKFDPEEDRKNLKMVYKKNYYQKDKEKFLDSLYKVYGFDIYEENLNEFLEYLDTNKTNLTDDWAAKVPKNIYSNVLFEFMGTKTSIGEFIVKMSKQKDLRGTSLTEKGIKKAIDKIITPRIIKKAAENLEKEYPEFKRLMKEFREGILLFKVEQEEVWNKLQDFDTAAARAYWDSTKEQYRTKPKFDVSEIYVLSDSMAKEIHSKLEKGGKFEELAKKYTQRDGYRKKKGHWGALDSTHKLSRIIVENEIKQGEYGEPVKNGKGYSIAKYNKHLPKRMKTFKEAISDFAAEFQELRQKKMEKQWIKSIKKKFPVKIYESNINKIFN